jgi:hypothetical protein
MKGGQFMRVIKRAVLFMVCVSLTVGALMPSKAIRGASPEAVAYDLPANSWQIPFAPKNDGMPDQQTMNDFYEFAWQSFIALNWPTLDGGERGQPDPAKMIGATQDGQLLPVVWSSYKLPSEVFLANAAPPAGWNDPPPPPPSYCKNVPAGAKVISMAAKDQPGVIGDVNQAGFPQSTKLKIRGPVADQMLNYVRYEIRFNRSEFEYFNINQYYDRNKQIAAVQNTQQNSQTPPPNPLKTPTYQFPPKGKESYVEKLPPYDQQGTIELKAAWRILDPKKDVVDRYYHIPAYIDNGGGNCKLQTVGLVGLHILRLTPGTGPTWIWATFEQVDNVEVGANAPRRPDGSALTPSLNPGPGGSPPPPYFPGGYFGDEPQPIPHSGPIPKPTAPNNISRLTDIPDDARAVNQKYQSMLSNTVWKNYELVGNLGPYVAGSSTPKPKFFVPNGTPPGSTDQPVYINSRDLANTTMEAYVQPTSCIICHAYAVPWGVFYSRPKDMNTFQSFTFLLRYANQPKTRSAVRSR